MKTTREVKEDGSFIETSTAQQNSIKVSKNAKGDLSWECKVYHDDYTEIEELIANYTSRAEARIEALKILEKEG